MGRRRSLPLCSYMSPACLLEEEYLQRREKAVKKLSQYRRKRRSGSHSCVSLPANLDPACLLLTLLPDDAFLVLPAVLLRG